MYEMNLIGIGNEIIDINVNSDSPVRRLSKT